MAMALARGTKGVRVSSSMGCGDFLIPISRVFVIFSGVIGPAFSAYFFGASFGVVSGVVLGSGVFF